MTQLAYKLKELPRLTVIEGGKSRIQNKWQSIAPTREMLILSCILVSLQILDGVLTACGMSFFGTSAEGNAILRILMEMIGHIPALVVCKGLAVLIVCALCVLSTRVSWLPLAMKGMIAIYTCAAILPWTYILYFHAY